MKYKIGDSFILNGKIRKEKITILSIRDNLYFIKRGCCQREFVTEDFLDKLEEIKKI